MHDVWIIDDHRPLRETAREALLLSGCGGVECFGACEPALRALRTATAPPRVILLDLSVPGMSGIDGLRQFKKLAPTTEIVVFTVCDDQASVFDAIRGGASGYLLKSEPLERIVTAVREVREGGVPMTSEIARRLLEHFSRADAALAGPGAASALEHEPAAHDLSAREIVVLRLLVEGFVKKEIACKMNLSLHTVDNHVRRIYAKLQVNTIGAAVARAVRDRLV